MNDNNLIQQNLIEQSEIESTQDTDKEIKCEPGDLEDNCIFCKIIKGEVPCYKIYEDENVLAFLDIADDCLGHTLVIPKKHYKDIFELPDDLYQKVLDVVRKLSIHFKKTCGIEGVNIVSANDKSAEQTVFHLHFHILPRTSDDEIHIWPQLQKQYQDFEAVQKKFKYENQKSEKS